MELKNPEFSEFLKSGSKSTNLTNQRLRRPPLSLK